MKDYRSYSFWLETSGDDLRADPGHGLRGWITASADDRTRRGSAWDTYRLDVARLPDRCVRGAHVALAGARGVRSRAPLGRRLSRSEAFWRAHVPYHDLARANERGPDGDPNIRALTGPGPRFKLRRKRDEAFWRAHVPYHDLARANDPPPRIDLVDRAVGSGSSRSSSNEGCSSTPCLLS